jgi:hypothetical protein
MTRRPPFAPAAPERVIEPLSLRPRAAAQALGISERLLYDWTRTEGVPHVRIGNVVLYPVDVLKNWLATKAITAEEVVNDVP